MKVADTYIIESNDSIFLDVLSALDCHTRIKILELTVNEELTFKELSEKLQCNIENIRQHVIKLKILGLVEVNHYRPKRVKSLFSEYILQISDNTTTE